MEQTVVIIKPDAMKKGHMGEIISRLEKAGFNMQQGKLVQLTEKLLRKWYAHHAQKPFFPDIVTFMIDRPVMAMIWEGKNIIAKVREMAGPTDSKKASIGTIRGDFGEDIQRNAIHASENEEAALKEIELLFS